MHETWKIFQVQSAHKVRSHVKITPWALWWQHCAVTQQQH